MDVRIYFVRIRHDRYDTPLPGFRRGSFKHLRHFIRSVSQFEIPLSIATSRKDHFVTPTVDITYT